MINMCYEKKSRMVGPKVFFLEGEEFLSIKMWKSAGRTVFEGVGRKLRKVSF